MTFTLAKSAALAAVLALPLAAGAQTPFAGEDFDGGATNGGFSSTGLTFTPNNDGTGRPRGTFGTGSGSIFDRWGEVSTADADNLPFGVVDESLDGFPGDTAGFVSEFKTDDFVLGVDTVNSNNPDGSGAVSASMSFDISGRSNLVMSIDMGMLGDFEEADLYEFNYSIDGGPSQLAFRVQGKTGPFYSWTMDDGTFVDRFTNTFFTPAEWQDLIDFGPTPGVIDYHPDDDGTNGDTTPQDGIISVNFASGPEDVRAYLDGSFDTAEFNPPKDPLVVTTGDGSLVEEQLIADFATYTTALVGSGSTLTLTINGVSDGGDEYFAFDNILLSEAAGLTGDYNSDGKVDAADYTVWRDGNSPDSSQTGYDAWADNYGATSTPPAVSVPEPTSLAVLLSAAAGLFAARRR
ncbi:PEP-CTERM sorting domain-containing protein [Botrimarina mediterranea]|uniref:PEP-CTERM protein-sorting domain-containing protein n=1 Tax=Botrimarina mediterranea TaxID=2528022 RepID=A0A518KDK8_9BACT|nr:PEP-CTERM sorting domain-containing protein [Botrimarina mediterranea]QDV75882.1 hypothetical protein Spa11_41050 [Botrimarina mediterranea]QDV80479.1 hypothetical protein K2D_41080 [Planctomycetes bacterium K2D]